MLTFHQILIRLFVAAGLGASIGVERDLRHRPAGIRTSMFVCLGTALFTVLSIEISHRFGDSSSTRIASNIVQGIGFLGAGAIMRDSAGTVGMTTAATIFVEAAIGMAAGGGFYAVAAGTTAIVLFALIVISWCAEKFNLKQHNMLFRFTTGHTENVATEIQQLVSRLKIPMFHFRVSVAGANSVVEFEAEVSHSQQVEIVAQLNRQGVVTEVVPCEGHHG